MNSRRKWDRRCRQRSIGNLALADDNRVESRHHEGVHLKLVPPSGAVLDHGLGTDPLSAAKGIVRGVGLSILLWSAIILLLWKIL